MKKITQILAILMLGGFLVAGSAMATPIYYGDTSAPDLTFDTSTAGEPKGYVPTNPPTAGYYIWSNDDQKTSWSIRWTGLVSSPKYTWSGSMEFDEHGSRLESYSPILWDAGDGAIIVSDTNAHPDIVWETVSFTATAGWHWDGIDFTISGTPGESAIGFNLESSLFNTLDPEIGYDVAGAGIFIGANFNTPNVWTTSTEGISGQTYINQNFEIPAPVPEPATMLLLGFGIVGLAGLGRKKFFKIG